jgi:MFS family permease
MNHAVHMAAATQIRYRHTKGRVYHDKKIAEGKTAKEAPRALKRQVSDALYQKMKAGARRAAGPGGHPGNGSEAMAQFLQIGLGQDPLGAGLRLLPWGVAPLLIAPRAGKLADRIGERPLVVSGLLLQAAGFAWIAIAAAPGLAYAALLAPMMISGAGLGLALPAVTKAVIGSVPRGDIGKASGSFSMMRQLGGAFGVAILAAVFAAAGGYTSATAFSAGFAPALAAAAGLALTGAVAGLALPGRPGRAQDASAEPKAAAHQARTADAVAAGR